MFKLNFLKNPCILFFINFDINTSTVHAVLECFVEIKNHFFSERNFVYFFVILGILLRFTIVSSSSYPINDGGMFYIITNTIAENNFEFPINIDYNRYNIPFAYPPFSFYLAAFVVKIFKITTLDLLHFLPFIFSSLTIPVFYFIVKNLFSTKTALFSLLAYISIPRSYEWQIMGGGLTRSIGTFFCFYAIYYGIIYFKEKKQSDYTKHVVFLFLTAITHLEWLFFATYTLIILLTLFNRKRMNFKKMIRSVFLVLTISSPWWLFVIYQHGIDVFLSFSRAGFMHALSPYTFLSPLFNLTDEQFIPFFYILSIIGLVKMIALKKHTLPILFFLPLLLAPRSSPNLIVFPISIISGWFLNKTFGKDIAKLFNFSFVYSINLQSKIHILLFIAGASLLTSILFTANILMIGKNNVYYHSLNNNLYYSMEWIKNNTKREEAFLVLSQTTQGKWGMDSVNEWFPAITERKSLTAPQGTEWLNKNIFIEKVRLYVAFGTCSKNEINCYEKISWTNDTLFNYVYIEKSTKNWGDASQYLNLIEKLQKNQSYQDVYSNNNVVIFEKIKK